MAARVTKIFLKMAKNLTIHEREDLKNRISKLYLQGYGVSRIANYVNPLVSYNVTPPTVHRHLKAILKTWYDEREADIDQRINTELLRLNEVEYQAWQAWHRSCKAKVKKTNKRKGSPKTKKMEGGQDKEYIQADYVSETEQTEEMIGDPRFLDIIQKCVDMRLQWLTKGSEQGSNKGSTNITNNTVLVMTSQERYVPEKLKQVMQINSVNPS